MGGSSRWPGTNVQAAKWVPSTRRQSLHTSIIASHLFGSSGEIHFLMYGSSLIPARVGRGMVNETPPQWHWARSRSLPSASNSFLESATLCFFFGFLVVG